ncbi:hypothetical protein PMAYCL1PPCAC_27110 [Pristionchus mayeri]|uniref:Uncharacterized protein n=1 Tax=Pristionchus mayeri TaxID=1317129 RepID=A0AAN5D6G4_9BILA|nr:hypothetical protein PMAYCL1PPCAC_27110 [Pristionchus mayeri]
MFRSKSGSRLSNIVLNFTEFQTKRFRFIGFQHVCSKKLKARMRKRNNIQKWDDDIKMRKEETRKAQIEQDAAQEAASIPDGGGNIYDDINDETTEDFTVSNDLTDRTEEIPPLSPVQLAIKDRLTEALDRMIRKDQTADATNIGVTEIAQVPTKNEKLCSATAKESAVSAEKTSERKRGRDDDENEGALDASVEKWEKMDTLEKSNALEGRQNDSTGKFRLIGGKKYPIKKLVPSLQSAAASFESLSAPAICACLTSPSLPKPVQALKKGSHHKRHHENDSAVEQSTKDRVESKDVQKVYVTKQTAKPRPGSAMYKHWEMERNKRMFGTPSRSIFDPLKEAQVIGCKMLSANSPDSRREKKSPMRYSPS